MQSLLESLKVEPQFPELAFGTWIAYLFLVFMWKRLLKIEQEGWKYALITVAGGSFYIINHYFMRASFYNFLHNSYLVVFLIVYYYVFVKHLKASALKKVMAFFSSFLFTVAYMLPESLARLAVKGKLIPGVNVPEFLFLLISFLACVGIILANRKRQF